MTVTIPAMALAAMVGSGCPVNQANMNQYSQVMNNPGSAQPYIQMQNGGASLDKATAAVSRVPAPAAAAGITAALIAK